MKKEFAPGLWYEHWEYQQSRVHMTTIDLEQNQLRPVMDKEEFPFNSGHPQTKAIQQGALVCGPGGFNIVLYHGLGIQDQPQHTLVVDEEIWTTGLGAGGYGVLVGDGFVQIQRNAVQVHVWCNGVSTEVEHVNRGHEGEVVAFNARGGSNEYPKYRGKHFVVLEGQDGTDDMMVRKVQQAPPTVWPHTVVLEATYDLKMMEAEVVKWKQDLGVDGVQHIMSGWPMVVADGVNVVPDYELDPEASNGPDGWFVRRNPRTAIGCSADGKTAYMMCVEGRLPNQWRPTAEPSRGLRLKALAETAVKHGVAYLVNMDGGGSAFQWRADGAVWGCYNNEGTIWAQRRAHFSASVF